MITETPDGSLSLRWRPLVQHAVRARRDPHRARDPLDRARDRARRARLPGRHPGHRDLAGARRAAGEDPARVARRRDGRPRRGAVRALLRQRRRHAALRDAGGGLPATHRGRRVRAALWRHTSIRRWPGSSGTATPTATGSSSTRARPTRASCSRGGRTRTIRSFTPTAPWRKGRSRSCEVQGYVYGAFRGRRRDRHRARTPGARRRLSPQGRGAARALRRDLLGRGARDVRAGARRNEAPLPGAQLERRARALERYRRAGATRAAPPRR